MASALSSLRWRNFPNQRDQVLKSCLYQQREIEKTKNEERIQVIDLYYQNMQFSIFIKEIYGSISIINPHPHTYDRYKKNVIMLMGFHYAPLFPLVILSPFFLSCLTQLAGLDPNNANGISSFLFKVIMWAKNPNTSQKKPYIQIGTFLFSLRASLESWTHLTLQLSDQQTYKFLGLDLFILGTNFIPNDNQYILRTNLFCLQN